MNVLVASASKHSSTSELAAAIAETLRAEGFNVREAAIGDLTAIDHYDACVLGSAVYGGHWLKPARTLVERFRTELAHKPVWLFSSGPIGSPARPEEEPVDVAAIVEAIGAREHRVFAGRLDKAQLGLGEKAMVAALRAPEGDFRDWDEIRTWAKGIAAELAVEH